MTGTPFTSESGGKPLPRAVIRASERARKLQEQQRERAGKAPEDLSGDEPAATKTPATTGPAAKGADATPNATPPVEPKPAAEVKPAADGSAATPPAPASTDGLQNGLFNGKDAKFWHDRYTSTLGVLRAERAQHEQETLRLGDELAQAQVQLATKAAKAPAAVKLDEYMTAEQIETLGEDKAQEILALARKVAAEQVESHVNAALKPLQEREQRRTQNQIATERQRVFDEIAEAVPNWEAINASDDWKEWCLEYDKELGKVRQKVINEAMADFESGPLIGLFSKFEKAQPAPAVTPGAKPPVQPKASASGGNQPPVNDDPGDDDPDDPDAGKPLTRAMVTKLYTKLAIDRSLSDRQREERRKKLDERVRKAQQSGQLA